MMALNLGYIAKVTSFEWGKGWSANGIIMKIPWKHAAGCFMMSGGNFYTLGKEQQESLAPEIHEVQSFYCQRPFLWPFRQSLFWRSNWGWWHVMTFTTLLDFHQPIWMFQRWNSCDRSPSREAQGLTAVKWAQETWHHDMWKQTWPWWWNQNWMLRLPSSNIDNGKPRFCRSAS